MMKGQTLEMLGFLILSVAVIGIIIFMRTYLAGSYGKTLSSLTERQETEGMRSGLNTILQTTDPKTGRKMEELIGIGVYTEKSELDFGRDSNGDQLKVNVFKDLEERLDAIYGKGKWHLELPYPDLPFYAQVVIVVDTSASLCDDVENMKRLPDIINNLNEMIKQKYPIKDKDKDRITATVYMLSGGNAGCCEPDYDGQTYLGCSRFEANKRETNVFRCRSINSLDCPRSLRPSDSLHWTNEEDWGRGLACIADNGPPEGWNGASTKIGIILSDELSTGNENQPEAQEASLESAINYANSIDMFVFPIKADTGIACCPSCSGCRSECNICVSYNGEQTSLFTERTCAMDSELISHMEGLMAGVNPPEFRQVYELEDSTEVTTAISDIIKDVAEREVPTVKLGAPIPQDRKVNTVTVTVPIPFIGGYTNLYLYQWQ